MICTNCGKPLEEGEIFCPSCGTKATVNIAAEQPMYGMECTQNDRTGAVQYKAPVQTGSTEAEYRAPSPTEQAPQPAAAPAKEKEYFGRGALVLCLVVIGILAASTGTFACLYLSAIGAI